MHTFIFRYTFLPNSVFLFRKLFFSEFLLGISETLLCPMSAVHAKIVPLLDVHQLIMLIAGILTYSDPKLFFSIYFICYTYYYYDYYVCVIRI
jgi:hypothetical protein